MKSRENKTTAKLSGVPPKGSGLTPSLADALWNARSAGREINDLVVVGLLSTYGHGEVGGRQSVTLKWTRLEIVRDRNEQANLREIMALAWEQRHSLTPLPLDFKDRSDDDQRRFLLGAIADRATELDLTDTDVGAAWREHFGISPGAKDTPAGWALPDYKKAAVHHIREFALTWGALADEAPEGDDVEDDDTGTGDDADGQGETDTEPKSSDEPSHGHAEAAVPAGAR